MILIDRYINTLKGWSNQRYSFVRHTLSLFVPIPMDECYTNVSRIVFEVHYLLTTFRMICWQHFFSAFIDMRMCDDYSNSNNNSKKNQIELNEKLFVSEWIHWLHFSFALFVLWVTAWLLILLLMDFFFVRFLFWQAVIVFNNLWIPLIDKSAPSWNILCIHNNIKSINFQRYFIYKLHTVNRIWKYVNEHATSIQLRVFDD